jgi:hypothetical protein
LHLNIFERSKRERQAFEPHPFAAYDDSFLNLPLPSREREIKEMTSTGLASERG